MRNFQLPQVVPGREQVALDCALYVPVAGLFRDTNRLQDFSRNRYVSQAGGADSVIMGAVGWKGFGIGSTSNADPVTAYYDFNNITFDASEMTFSMWVNFVPNHWNARKAVFGGSGGVGDFGYLWTWHNSSASW